MTSLSFLDACFEGVVPSILCTLAADGTPNVSYLSHVARLGDAQVALSNQFFSKTSANLRGNPRAALLIVDPRNGTQHRLDILYRGSVQGGPAFDRMAADLRATSVQLGMADVMRLRAIDIFDVLDVRQVQSDREAAPPGPPSGQSLARALAVTEALMRATALGGMVDAVLDALASAFGHEATLLLLHEPARGCLVALGSRGYGTSGIGAEVPLGEGLIGLAAQDRRPVRVGDASRLRRYGAAILAGSEQEARTRSVALPRVPDAMSQIAVPMEAQGRLQGVLFLESKRRMAFDAEDGLVLSLVARQLGLAIALAEAEAGDATPLAPSGQAEVARGRSAQVVHHAQDDSVFIDHQYLVKGVPGRLLMWMLDAHSASGRIDFTNREIRADAGMRLPELKDNLETRLLLLQRRLEDKRAPLRLHRPARGRIRLEVTARLDIVSDRNPS
ncbi:GAF domain-containing protein [Sabulicella glaciei]|uniref:GAF domain-containing protein n=1 Tax=Sabulicella glaciei TaxID=2984948 RepID=A0ABT3P1A2_9PROT|nr:GAF domain-containing protein [Roseococcus sp. MDT2-1-1]MCW8088182.1 GAF domain-containing protein [Roseococcus sp. MDT2-1-1]